MHATPRFPRPSVALVLSLLGAGCAPAEAEPAAAEPAAPETAERTGTPPVRATRVEVAEVEPSAAVIELELPGEVEGGRDAQLSAPLGGYVERVLVEDGENVRRGAALLRVDSSVYSAQVAQAQVELDEAEREWARARRLGDALPDAQRDQAQSRLARAKATMRIQRLQLARSVVRAPFAGVVVRVDVEQGEVAAPGAPLIRLVQLDPLKISVSVSDRDVVALEPGLEGVVRVDARAGLLPAKLTRIEPAADLDTRAFTVEFSVPNDDRTLFPGMIAAVRVRKSLGAGDLVVPQDFVVTRLEGLGVFVVEDGVARWRPIELGRVVRDQVVVRSGLAAGDVVVVVGHRELQDGDALIVTRRGRCCEQGRVRFDESVAQAADPAPGAE